jgi:Zn-dependent protease
MLMRWSWRLAKVNGAPVEVHWLFGLLLAWTSFVGWTHGRVLAVIYTNGLLLTTFACILLHEIGHTLQAQAVGIPVRRIVLLPFVGLAQLAHVPERPRGELRVAVAGPAVNFGLMLLAGGRLAVWLVGSSRPSRSMVAASCAVPWRWRCPALRPPAW